MDIQQTSPSFSNNNASQKTQVNGLDSGTPVGFRHHLPQIAVMARNPKIAQSKASAKTELANLEKATVHVEGVGKVLQIREEGMEVENSPPKPKSNGQDTKEAAEKLLESVEMLDTLEPADAVEESVKVSDTGTAGLPSEADEKEIAQSTESSETETLQTPTVSEMETTKPLNIETIETENTVATETKKSSPEIPKSEGRTRRKSSVAKAGTTEKSSAEKETVTGSTSANTELSSSDELSSPVGKRQRKPKKLDIEVEAETPKQKTPKEKPAKVKPAVTPDVEAKFPGRL